MPSRRGSPSDRLDREFSRSIRHHRGCEDRREGIVVPGLINTKTVFAALLGAITWNLLTWWFGLPSSSSHALIGGLVGAALAQSGDGRGVVARACSQCRDSGTHCAGDRVRRSLPAVGCHLLGVPAAHRGVANRGFRSGQIVSGTFVAFTHGANDAQKTMGVIALALFANGNLEEFEIPTWVKISARLVVAAGTYVGGWRIMRTLGRGSEEWRTEAASPPGQRRARSRGDEVRLSLSTTRGDLGPGRSGRARPAPASIRSWGVAGNIVVAWVLNGPAAAAVAAMLYWPIQAVILTNERWLPRHSGRTRRGIPARSPRRSRPRR